MIDFTTVVGVDDKHFEQLRIVWPTWAKHKPQIVSQPMVVFVDNDSKVTEDAVRNLLRHKQLRVMRWPDDGQTFQGNTTCRFHHPQRYKMLAGFVHVPARLVSTPYWLKLDTDVVAVGTPDWIDDRWFRGNPSIVAHAWSFTKPPNQMEILDDWVKNNREQLLVLNEYPPLDLHPESPESERLGHRRIISWCGFFSTTMTRLASGLAERVCGPGQLPVPSQDGYLWYVATRMQTEVVRTSMKKRGWEWWSTMRNVKQSVHRSLHG